MKLREILILISASLLITGCGFAVDQVGEISETRTQDLIRHNIMLGDDRFTIEDPLAYQYGNIHVDGPSGGMLYRFRSSSEALAWIVEQHHLNQITITAGDQLPLQFLDDRPRWWGPDKTAPNVYYAVAEEFSTGGERRFIVVFDTSTNIIYIVEHFSDMPGI